VKQTFEPVIITQVFPRSQIDIFLQILQHDGGIVETCINAATLALVDAGIPMVDYVCACTAGCLGKDPVLDLNHAEESSESPKLTVAILPKTGRVNLLQMESRIHIDMFENVVTLATEGCAQIHQILEGVTRDRAREQLQALS
jgi:exosome complex component RRP41